MLYKIESMSSNTGEATVIDPLIRDDTVAKIRGVKELLEKGTTQKRIRVKIARTQDVDFKPGVSTIDIAGVRYLVEKVSYKIDGIDIWGVRYE